MTEPIQQTPHTATAPNVNDTVTAEPSFSQTALNVILMLVETLLTLLLRFDANLRQVMYPLAQDNTVVCIRSYVPHTTIYATFTVNGILLDSQLHQNQQVDVTINGFTWQIAQAILTHNLPVIEQLQLRGSLDKVALVKNFLLAVGIAPIVERVQQTIGKKGAKATASDSDSDPQDASNKDSQPKNAKPTEAAVKARIQEQQNTINQLTIDKTAVQTEILQLKSKNKVLTICVAVLGLLLIGVIIAWLLLA